MVTKTELCEFSEYRIYPGRGSRYVTKDGKVHIFMTKKSSALFKLKKKAAALTWTQTWRRNNKKIKSEDLAKRRTKKTTRVQKAVVGMSLDEIRRRKNEKPEDRDKNLEASKKEIKDRQRKQKESKQVDKKKQAAQQQKAAKPAPAGGKGGKGGKGGR